MGSAGHKFIAHTKGLSPRVGAATDAYGLPPHPLQARPGQRYWSRTGSRRAAFDVKRVAGDQAHGQREAGGVNVTVTLPRLLAVRDEDDQGRWYQFLGCLPRRYKTFAQVVDRDERLAVLCVPEWHPRRPALLFTRLLPPGADAPGAWVGLTCDLSAPSGSRLQPSGLVAVAPPDATVCHASALTPEAIAGALSRQVAMPGRS